MIYAFTPNPAWDVTYNVPSVTLGESHRVEAYSGRAGGKGVNAARVANFLGKHVVALAAVGGALGTAFSDDLKKSGVPHRLLQGPATRQSIAIVPADGSHPTLFNEAGAHYRPDAMNELLLNVRDAIQPGSLVLMCGSVPPGWDSYATSYLSTQLLKRGCRVWVDTSGQALTWAVDAGVDLIKVNAQEITQATAISDPAEAVRSVKVKHVVVTDGAKGMTAYVDGQAVAHAVLDQPVSGNPTGAGDAAMAALALAEDKDWPQRLAYAVAVSAAAVKAPVAGMVDPEDVQALLQRVKVKDLT